jgi:putative heme-binding domain-containing protein
LVVRTIAANQLVARKASETAGHLGHVLRGSPNPLQRMHAVWVLERLGALDAESLWRGYADSDSRVRAHAMKAIAGRDRAAPSRRAEALAAQELDRVRATLALDDADPFVLRGVAEVLGNMSDRANLTWLLRLRDRIPAQDTHLLHTVRIAMRNQFRTEDWPAFVAQLTDEERAARHLADLLPGVESPLTAPLLLKHLQSFREDRDTTARYVRHVARHGSAEQQEALLALARQRAGDDLADQLALVRAVHDGIRGRSEQPHSLRSWAEQLCRKLFDSNQPQAVGDAVELVRSMTLASLEPAVAEVAAGKNSLAAQRPAALSALAAINPSGHFDLFRRIVGDPSEPLELRQHVAGILGGMNQPEAHAQLVDRLRTAPEQLAVHLAAALAASRAGAERLLAEIAAGKSSPRLLQHPFVSGRLEATGLADVRERIAKLTEALPPADTRLGQLIDERRAGFAHVQADTARGATLFEKHCAACHAISGRGGKVGPQLDGIGGRGVERLLEDLLDPNRNVDQAFRASLIALRNGQVLNGLVLSDETERLVLADSAGKELVVAKDDIDERTLSKLSPMPANVSEVMSERDFYDLIEYLLAQSKID